MSDGLVPAIDADRVTVYIGDTVGILPLLEPSSVSSVVTDPPYGLEFCGQDWDGATGFRESLVFEQSKFASGVMPFPVSSFALMRLTVAV